MIILILIQVLISLICGLNQTENQLQFWQKITDCIFVQNNTESVELICDVIDVNATKSRCYSTLFDGGESTRSARLKVKQLTTGKCRSQTLDTNLAEKFPNLDILDIAYLGFKVPSQSSVVAYGDNFYFEKLKKLNASHNEIRMIDEMFYYTESLTNIDLSFNSISIVLSSSFETNDAVQWIDLSHNSISRLDVPFDDMANLQSINLSNNFLETFDLGVFARNVKLRIIRLENNRIKQFTYDIHGMIPIFDTLVLFSTAGNQIENLNEIYLQCLGPKLKTLDLSYSLLGHLNSSMFVGLNSLTHLNFRHTNLSHFDFHTFPHPEKTKSIDLSHNFLSTYHMDAFNLTKNFSSLEVLNLEDNDLHDLRNISNITLPKLSSVAISMNRLSCDYAKKFTKQWSNIEVVGDECIQKAEIQVKSAENYFVAYTIFAGVTVVLVLSLGYVIWITYLKLPPKIEPPIELNSMHSQSIQTIDGQSEQNSQYSRYEEPIYSYIEESRIAPKNDAYDRLDHIPLPSLPPLPHYDTLNKRRENQPN